MKRRCLFLILFLITLVISGCAHVHKYEDEIIKSTCYEEGYTKHTCECGDTYNDNYTPIEHKYGEWEVIQEATKDEKGIREAICSICNDKKTEEFEHVHDFKEVHKDATCTEDGYDGYACECGEEKDITVIASEGHSYSSLITKETCTTKGYTTYTCECGDSYVDDYVEETGHKFGEWNVTKEATFESEGLKTRECECGEKESLVIPKKENIKVMYDLDGGHLEGYYSSVEDLSADFIADYNKYSNTTATISNFLKDSSASVKQALANKEMLEKWNWLFAYMYEDLIDYNTSINALGVGYVSDTIDLLPLLIQKDTNVILDSSKGPNFRTLVRSYLHGLMNKSKGDPIGNPTFSGYAPDFSIEGNQEKLLAAQYNVEFNAVSGDELLVPNKSNYIFEHWLDPNGNVTDFYTIKGTYKAVWNEGVKVDTIEITNKIEEINVFDTFQLSWLISPSNAINQKVKFTSSDESILTIDSKGYITTKKAGQVTITITSLAIGAKTDSFTLSVTTTGYFDISYETNSFVEVGESINLKAIFINKYGASENVIFESLNNDIATVNSEGNVLGVSTGLVNIRAYSQDKKQHIDFVVTVISSEVSDAIKLILDSHVSNVYTTYNLGIGAGTPVYYTDIFGSVSELLFDTELEINTKYNQATNNKYGEELQNRLLESVEFITVHYTGGMSKGSTAESTANYFTKPLSQVATSIHYCTGNDGIFKGLDEEYRAAHAGDDGSLETVSSFSWIDTNVEVLPTDPETAIVSITKNATFSINGVDTGIKVPEETKFGRGYVTDDKWLNKMDLAVNIKDGKYQLGTSWWCYTQVWEGRICSNGGNRNSIGIESAVNKGSDLWLTWQMTAQLCADIMYRYDLDITRVKGHHFFSAKNCPQPMLENDLEIWYEFLELVKAEHEKLLLGDIEIEFSCDSNLVNEKGRVVGQENNTKVVTYTVNVKHNGYDETITLASIIEGVYNK